MKIAMKILLVLVALLHAVEGRRTTSRQPAAAAAAAPAANDTRRSLPCASPTSKAAVTFPASLAGQLKMTNKMYSGYVPPDGPTGDKYLFYWFFEADAAAKPSSAPLILWTNGGPGCSSMEGATTEISPLSLLDIKADERLAAGTLSDNFYAWTRHGNLLFLDQPGPVGYSFGNTVSSSEQAGLDVVKFLRQWLILFPEFNGRTFLIAGESYAGHYLPAIAAAIKSAGASLKLQFKGIVLGNGCVDDAQDSNTYYLQFAQAQHLVPASFNSQSGIDSQITYTLGYSPNYYDYRVKDVSCNGCFSYDYTTWARWLRSSAVTTALHVCGNAGDDAFSDSAGGCIYLPGFDNNYPEFGYRAALEAALAANVAVTFFYGTADRACNYKGGQAVAKSLQWSGRNAFNSAPLLPYTIAGAPVGRVQTYGLLTYIEIDGAGHMVPLDQPASALFALQRTLVALGLLAPDAAIGQCSTPHAPSPTPSPPIVTCPPAIPCPTVPAATPCPTAAATTTATTAPPVCPACPTPEPPPPPPPPPPPADSTPSSGSACPPPSPCPSAANTAGGPGYTSCAPCPACPSNQVSQSTIAPTPCPVCPAPTACPPCTAPATLCPTVGSSASEKPSDSSSSSSSEKHTTIIQGAPSALVIGLGVLCVSLTLAVAYMGMLLRRQGFSPTKHLQISTGNNRGSYAFTPSRPVTATATADDTMDEEDSLVLLSNDR